MVVSLVYGDGDVRDILTFCLFKNLFHGIIILSAQRRGESCIRPNPGDPNPDDHNQGDHKDRPYGTLPDTLHCRIHWGEFLWDLDRENPMIRAI